MAKKIKEEKAFKEYSVIKGSIGTAINWKGKHIILNNGEDGKHGIPQTTLKAMHAFGIKSIVKNAK